MTIYALANLPPASTCVVGEAYYTVDFGNCMSDGTVWRPVAGTAPVYTIATLPAAASVPAGTQLFTSDNNGSCTSNGNAWVFTTRAALVPPPAAAAAGYNVPTFGPQLSLNGNWFPYNFEGVTPIPGQAVQNTDGSITLPGADGSGFGANMSTAHVVSNTLKGIAFSGGYYLKAVAKFTPTLGSGFPFPAIWGLDSGFLTNNYPWPGQPPGFNHRIELDLMQWPLNSLSFWEGAGLIDWFGYGSLNTPKVSGVQITGTGGQFSCTATAAGKLIVGNYITISGTFGGTGSITGYANPTAYAISATDGMSTFTLQTVGGSAITTTAGTPTGLSYQYASITQPLSGEIKMGPVTANPFNFANYNSYEWLVTPATAATQGSILNYLNGVQVNYAAGASNTAWSQYSSGNAPPPQAGTTAGSLLDTVNMVFIIGTSAGCPMTIKSFEIWQPSGALNLIQ